MTPRVKIGILADTDMRHYSFERNSRLPSWTFEDRSDRWGDVFAVVVAIGGFILALICGWG